jgi:hypothetical protein
MSKHQATIKRMGDGSYEAAFRGATYKGVSTGDGRHALWEGVLLGLCPNEETEAALNEALRAFLKDEQPLYSLSVSDPGFTDYSTIVRLCVDDDVLFAGRLGREDARKAERLVEAANRGAVAPQAAPCPAPGAMDQQVQQEEDKMASARAEIQRLEAALHDIATTRAKSKTSIRRKAVKALRGREPANVASMRYKLSKVAETVRKLTEVCTALRGILSDYELGLLIARLQGDDSSSPVSGPEEKQAVSPEI